MSTQKDVSEVQYRVLVVDDDEDILDLIKITLEGSQDIDVKVVTTNNPQTGLKLLESSKFDIVLSDHRMTGMSGVELLSHIREKYPDIIRVLITAYSELELARDAINRANVDLYIEKPWTRDQIREDIKMMLEGISSVQDEDVELEDGVAYLFEERKPKVLYQAGLERIRSLGEGMIISRMHPKKANKMFDVEASNVDFYWLSKMTGEKTLDPVHLELIADMIIRYFEGGGKTVILDGMDSLLRDNSFKRFEGFIDNIVDVASMEDGTFLTGMDPRIIHEKELATIEKKMRALSFGIE